jgi:branched-subunit amino acid transport protein
MSEIGGLGTWLIVVFGGLVTFAVRASFILMPPDTDVPGWLTGSLKYVAAAVLPALLIPDVLFRDAAAGDVLNVYRIIAAVVAAAFAIKTRSTIGTMLTGMAILWLLKWWAPF